MFKKHVATPTLDACTRALVHATSDGSDATKVGLRHRPAAMCIQLKLLTGPEGDAMQLAAFMPMHGCAIWQDARTIRIQCLPYLLLYQRSELVDVQLLHDFITSVLL